MRILETILLLTTFNLGLCDEGIPLGKRFESPDKKRSVHLAKIDGLPHFAIGNTINGHRDDSIEMPTILLFFAWSADSKAIITVEHIARGSYARILSSHGERWTAATLEPPGKGIQDYMVAKLTIDADHVYFKYAVVNEATDGRRVNYQLYECDANPTTGKAFNERWTHSAKKSI